MIIYLHSYTSVQLAMVHVIKKFTLRNHGKAYLAYVSMIQVRLTLEESSLTKVRNYVCNLTYVSTYGAHAHCNKKVARILQLCLVTYAAITVFS